MVEGVEMRLRRIVDVGGVDAVLTVADEAQPPGPCPLGQARQQFWSPGPQISRGRSATVARSGPFAASTACSAIFLVVAYGALKPSP